MSPVEWYYARGNKQTGPVSSAELKRLASAGELRPEDLVWREGMSEWTLARNVRGLFEEENKAAAAMAEVLSSPAAGGPSVIGPAAATAAVTSVASRARRTPRRHLFDMLLDVLRAQFTATFVDKMARASRKCGSYGLFVAMALVAAFAIITAAKARSIDSVPSGVVLLLVLVALQYVADKFCDALEQLNRTTSSSLSSTAFPDCCALMNIAAGVAALLGSVIVAVGMAMHAAILFGVAGFLLGLVAFLVCGYLAVVALNLSALNISIATEVRAGEEAIGVATFTLKAFLRLVPVAYGAGVVCGTILMGYACYQAFSAADLGVGGVGMGGGMGMMVEIGAGMTAGLARTILIWSAALPFVAYLLFLLYCLVIEVCRAFLILPGKIDKLAAKDEVKQNEQHP